MNTRRALDGFLESVANHVDFNNDYKHFAVACSDGFKIYSSETCDLYMQQELNENVRTASMLESSQIVGLNFNGEANARKLQLYDATLRRDVASISVRSPIVRCRLSKDHIAIVCERKVNLYRHQPSIEKLAAYETSPNSLGLCCLGSRVLAFPGRTPGQIQIVELVRLRVSIVPAHTSPLRALALGRNDELIASASQNGTLVRLHTTTDSARLGELRRGVAAANIYSLAISPSGEYLALTSDTNTMHIFNLPHRLDESESHQKQRGSPNRRPGSSSSSQANSESYFNVQKWGSLAKMPFAPRIFSDVYSFATATCDLPLDELVSPELSRSQDARGHLHPSLAPTIRPKGIVGWVDDVTLVVISAGIDARYERFTLDLDSTGTTVCKRAGWSRFMRPN